MAVLLLHANQRVSRDRLIDELWGEEPPASAAHSVDVYVSRLRKTLADAGGNGALTTRGNGYELRVESGQSDVERFEHLVEQSRVSTANQAAVLLREALRLWRGPPLADVDLPGSTRTDVFRLEELRLAALEERIEADLLLGRYAALVGELQALVTEHPVRERLRAQQMRALYGAGRQAEALDAYAEARRTLAELGLEPSPELKEFQRLILTHDPSLQPVGGSSNPAQRRRSARRRSVLVAVAAFVATGAVAWAIVLARGSGATSVAVKATSDSIGLFDPATQRLVADIPLTPGTFRNGNTPGEIAVGLGSVWVCDFGDETLLRVDPQTRRVVRTIGLGAAPAAVTVGHGAVWVEAKPTTQVIELDSLGNLVRRIPLVRRGIPPPFPHYAPASIASGPDAIWAVHGLAQVAKIDPRTGRVLHDTPDLGGALPGDVLATSNGVWVTGTDQARLIELDPATGAVIDKTTPAGGALANWFQLTTGAGGLWVTDSPDDLVWRLDASTNRPNASVAVGTLQDDRWPSGIASQGGSIWVVDSNAGTIDEIDPTSMRVTSRTRLGPSPENLASGLGGLWVSFGSATSS